MESPFHCFVYVYIFLSVYNQPLDYFHWNGWGQFQFTVFWSFTQYIDIQIYRYIDTYRYPDIFTVSPQNLSTTFLHSQFLPPCLFQSSAVSAYRTPLHSGPHTSLHSQECTQEWCQAPLPDPRPLDYSPALRTAWGPWHQGPWP